MGEPLASSSHPSHQTRKEELWKGPPPPPDAQQVAKDLSCQGIIAFTLKEALDDILAEQEQVVMEQAVMEQEVMEQTHLNSTPTGTATEENETESNQISNNNNNNQINNASEPTHLAQTPLVRMDQSMVTQILQAFGTSVAHSQQERYSQQQRQGSAAAAATTTTVESPAALLKGRLKHYNRRNTKWRIILLDVDFQRRRPLDKNRRKRERPSLWQVGREHNQQQQQQQQQQQGSIAGQSTSTLPPTQKTNKRTTPMPMSNCTLQILAYNDLE